MSRYPDRNTSTDYEMVTLCSTLGMDGRMEAEIIHGILESNEIFAFVPQRPSAPYVFEVKVAREDLEKAQRAIEQARAAGEK